MHFFFFFTSELNTFYEDIGKHITVNIANGNRINFDNNSQQSLALSHPLAERWTSSG